MEQRIRERFAEEFARLIESAPDAEALADDHEGRAVWLRQASATVYAWDPRSGAEFDSTAELLNAPVASVRSAAATTLLGVLERIRTRCRAHARGDCEAGGG